MQFAPAARKNKQVPRSIITRNSHPWCYVGWTDRGSMVQAQYCYEWSELWLSIACLFDFFVQRWLMNEGTTSVWPISLCYNDKKLQNWVKFGTKIVSVKSPLYEYVVKFTLWLECLERGCFKKVVVTFWTPCTYKQVQTLCRAGPRGRAREWTTLGVHPLSWLLNNNRLEEVCGTLTKGTFSSRLLLSNQDKGCTPSVVLPLVLPLGPALHNLSNILLLVWSLNIYLGVSVSLICSRIGFWGSSMVGSLCYFRMWWDSGCSVSWVYSWLPR